jgi:hypothetical protein
MLLARSVATRRKELWKLVPFVWQVLNHGYVSSRSRAVHNYLGTWCLSPARRSRANRTTPERIQSVSDPQQADLVFKLQLTAPFGPADVSKQKGASDPWPMFRLVIFDRKTHYVLLALAESIKPANLQKTHDHNFDEALATLVLALKKLIGGATTSVPRFNFSL